MGEGVKIVDVGARLFLSGTDAEEVKGALHAFLTRGAKLVSPPMRLGGKWVTACTVPVEPHPSERAAPEDDDPCKVEELGLKRIVTGPTRGLVRLKAEELVQMGGTLIGDVENVDGTWTALCDTGGTRNTGSRW